MSIKQSTRRTFLKSTITTASAALTAATSSQCIAAEAKPPLIIDCHAHIYGEDAKTYPTISKPYRPPTGSGTISHLKTEMVNAGVSHVTAIQTSTYYRWDNRFTVESAQANRKFMAGVCTLNPNNPHSADILKNYVENFNVRGMRSVAARNGRLDHPGVNRLWSVAEKLGIVINVLVAREKRPEIEALAKRHPKLNIVIDHCLNLKAGPTLKETLQDVIALSRIPNLHAKLTFIPTGTAQDYPCRDMHAACLQVIEAFGPDRCVWGSDFPCELWCPKFTYAEHLKIFTHELGLDESTRKAILGQTAQRLWFS